MQRVLLKDIVNVHQITTDSGSASLGRVLKDIVNVHQITTNVGMFLAVLN